VFNYDIPYNPTRVIQRVGRINRINKKVFDELYIFNYFPTATGEAIARIKRLSTLKIAMIHALFGEDTKVLTKDEELESYFTKQFRDSLKSQDEVSPETEYEDYIRNLRAKEPSVIAEAMKLPKRCRIKRSKSSGMPGVLVFGKKGDEYAFKYSSNGKECVSLGVAEALGLFKAEVSENADNTSKEYDSIYSHILKNLFIQKKEVALDRGKTAAIDKVEVLKTRFVNKKDYFDDLLYILKELDGLPERYARLIRGIDADRLEEGVIDLEKEVPHKYLVGIIEREQKIDEGKESLIVSEELIS